MRESGTRESGALESGTLESEEVLVDEAVGYDNLSGELIRLTRLLERAYARYSAQSGDGVERAAYLLLVHLVKHGPRRLSSLAEAVHSDVSTVSRQVTQLVQLGLVARQPDPSDGRASMLAATGDGVRTYERKRARRTRHFAELLEDWPTQDWQRLHELVTRFNDDFERYHRTPRARGAETAEMPDGNPR